MAWTYYLTGIHDSTNTKALVSNNGRRIEGKMFKRIVVARPGTRYRWFGFGDILHGWYDAPVGRSVSTGGTTIDLARDVHAISGPIT